MRFYFTILNHYFINILYHFIILPRSKTLFLLKYYFLIHYLLFLFIRSVSFLWAFQRPFLFLSPLAPVQHTTHTHDTPINLSKPITTPTHTNTNIKPATKPHTQTQTHSKTGPPIKNPSQATNPHRRFETQATDQKPEQTHSKKIITGANPFKKHHHRSKPIKKKIITEANPFKKIITRANPFKKHHHRSKPVQKKSSPEPLEQIHSKK